MDENERVLTSEEFDELLRRPGLTELRLAQPRWGSRGEYRIETLSERQLACICAIPTLTSLALRGLAIGDDGARAIASLTRLTQLCLNNTQIGAEGAQAIASLTGLTQLDLGGNEIGDEGARAIASLAGLTHLGLGGNYIGDEGARAIASMTGLTVLGLAGNGIGAEGARAIASLTGLTQLDLGYIHIGDEGARAIASLTGLTHLDLHDNRIGDKGARAILDAWVDRAGAQLQILNLRNDGDLGAVLPPEALQTSDAQAILAAYRRYRDREQLKPLNQAKLLVVGNEAVGKTSLVRYLIDGKPRDPDERATPRAAIHERINTESWSPNGGQVHLNVWDFGGQEIMRGTHQFFLTHRSLYLIVLEDRRQDDRSVYEWLRIVRSRGGESPVIVVINKCDKDEPLLRLNETELAQQYGVVKVVRTSCNDDARSRSSVEALRALIAETVVKDERLKHVRDPIPAAWLRVKESITDLARKEKVLDRSAFERICGQGEGTDAVSDSDEQRALLGLLHDLGVVVAHGLDRNATAARREIHILDPNWLTGAIYALITSPKVLHQDGELRREQLPELLDPTIYPSNRYEFILDMMKTPELSLCFELPGSNGTRWLIPEALRSNQPDYGTWPPDSLRFRYEYEELPAGLIPRFIVQAHKNLTKHPTRWRTGVVLEAAGCPVLIIGNRDKGRIDIQVAGKAGQRRSALSIVLNYLDGVHEHYEHLGAKALVPLPQARDAAVQYDHLLRLEERYGSDHEFLPTDAEREYTVKELLDGVRREGQERRREKVAVQARVPEPPPDRTNWPYISIACGAAAALLTVVLMSLPDEWRARIGVPAAIFAAVTLLVLSRNPANYYRRTLTYVLSGGLLLHAVGFGVEVFAKADPQRLGWLKWDGSIHPVFYPAWAVIAIGLIVADVKTRR